MSPASIETRSPRTGQEWQHYYELRWRILRAPWQAHGPERDETDETSTHRMSGSWTDSGYTELPGTGTIDADFESVTNEISTVNDQTFIRLRIEGE